MPHGIPMAAARTAGGPHLAVGVILVGVPPDGEARAGALPAMSEQRVQAHRQALHPLVRHRRERQFLSRQIC